MKRPEAGARLAVGFRVGRFPALSETFVLGQVEAMHATGLRVSVLADEADPAAGAATAAAVGGVHYTRPRDRRLARAFDALPWRLRRASTTRIERRWLGERDVVLCHFGWSGASLAEAVRGMRSRPPFAVVFHGDDLSRMVAVNGPRFYERLFEEADLLMPVSNLWANRLRELGAPPDRIVVHRMGVDLRRFSLRPPRDTVSRSCRLLTVGRLVPKKGIDVALRALARMKEQDRAPAVRLDVVGAGPLLPDLRALSSELGLGNEVEFHGPKPPEEVRRMLMDADVFVLASRTAPDGDMEGVPVALMEAMASGVPVVSTFHSGIPELIDDGRDGILCAEGDAEDLADRLLALINEPATMARLAAAGRRTIETSFDNERLNQRLDHLLVALARSGTSAAVAASAVESDAP